MPTDHVRDDNAEWEEDKTEDRSNGLSTSYAGMGKKRPILCLCIPHSSSSREGGMAKLACSRQLLLLCTMHLAFLQGAA